MRRWIVVVALAHAAGACDDPVTPSVAPVAPAPIVSEPLADRGPASDGPLFERLTPEQTGVAFEARWNSDEEYAAELCTAAPGVGVAVGDADGDGRPDLYLSRPFGGCRFYRNLGGFRFEDDTRRAGLEDPGWGSGAAFVDVDNDGDLDLFVAGYDVPNRLYLNKGDGTFEERAREFGLDFKGYSTTMAFADVDRDGWLDGYLLTGHRIIQDFPDRFREFVEEGPDGGPVVRPGFEDVATVIALDATTRRIRKAGQSDRLYRNERGARFRQDPRAGFAGHDVGLGAIWWDFDSDGWPDLYVANDIVGRDQLWRNQRDGTFRNAAAATIGHTPFASMGVDVADVDNDGLLDLFATDMAGTTHYKNKVSMGDMSGVDAWLLTWGEPRQVMQNALYLNTGTGRFQEAAALAGLAATDWTWSPRLLDLDNDGRTDLFVTNGMMRDVTHSDRIAELDALMSAAPAGAKEAAYLKFWRDRPARREPNLAFRNLGDLRFEPVGPAWGLDHDGVSTGAAAGDFDGDGDLDLVVGNFEEPASVYRNRAGGHRVTIRLVGKISNHRGVDAVVRLEAGGLKQVRHLTAVRGYLSSDEPILQFGLGEAPRIDRLDVVWPSGRTQLFTDLEADRRYTIAEPDAPPPPSLPAARSTLFARAPLEVRHRELPFDDFKRQSLLPNKLTQLGPGVAVADVDGDGRDDLYMGGAGDSHFGVLQINEGGGKWRTGSVERGAGARPPEELGVLFFDADGDGDPDLFTATGGYESGRDDPQCEDRLFLNDGKGAFSPAPEGALPALRDAGSAVCAADVDRDGDLDLFVGSRVVPGEYPLSPPSRLLRNEGGRFVEAAALEAGMVTGALWSDVDDDGWVDLMAATEYGPVWFYRNEGGTLAAGREAAPAGWWNGIAGADFDGDGDIDYAVTNFGLNTKYHASPDHPQELYYGELVEGSGPQIVEAGYEGGVHYPIRGKSCSSRAMPGLVERFGTYDAFAKATFGEIYGPRAARARRWEARELRSGVLLNQAGSFTFLPFPRAAQTAPAFGVVATEIDGDGKPDVVLAQNFFTPQAETPRMDGGVGAVLLGRGDGTFAPVRADASGWVVPGDGKGLASGDFNGDGRMDLAAAQNDGALLLFESRVKDLRMTPVRLKGRRGNPTAVGARVTAVLGDGSRRTVEVHAGGGYWSQSATAIASDRIAKVEVRWPDGTRTTHAAPSGVIDMAQPPARLQDPDPRKGPAIRVTLEERRSAGRPVFHVEAATDLPDGAVIDLRLYYEAVGPQALRNANVRVLEGTARLEFPVFTERTFPGRFVLTARASRPDQPAEILRWLRGRDLILEAEAELRVGTPEDFEKARRRYLDELSACFDRIDAVRKEILGYPKPGDAGWRGALVEWSARVRREGDRLRPREENRLLNLLEDDPDIFQRMEFLIGDLVRTRAIGGEEEARRIAAIGARIERRRLGHLHKVGAPSSDLAKAGILFDELTLRMGQAGAAPDETARMVLELGALLPPQAQEVVQALAAEADAPGSDKVRDLLVRLQEWVDAVRIKP